MLMLLHITAGAVGIISGFVALFAAKGARLHLRSGRMFVYSMVTLGVTGIVIAAVRGQEANVIAGFLAAYLVITALTTVRPRTAKSRKLDLGGLVVALAIGLASTTLAFDALSRGGIREGIPAPVLFMFAIVGLLAAAGDLRMIRSGALRAAPRLARHLWRMCFALYIASASFFLGQAARFPDALRNPALLAIPVLTPLLAMLYWLWRVRIRRTFRGIHSVRPPEAAIAGRE